jgi:hypothetical protein
MRRPSLWTVVINCIKREQGVPARAIAATQTPLSSFAEQLPDWERPTGPKRWQLPLLLRPLSHPEKMLFGFYLSYSKNPLLSPFKSMLAVLSDYVSCDRKTRSAQQPLTHERISDIKQKSDFSRMNQASSCHISGSEKLVVKERSPSFG